MNRQKKAAASNLKKDPDYFKKLGAKGGKKSQSWLKGNSDYMGELSRKRWAKYYELQAEQYEQEAKEALESYKQERGENE